MKNISFTVGITRDFGQFAVVKLGVGAAWGKKL